MTPRDMRARVGKLALACGARQCECAEEPSDFTPTQEELDEALDAICPACGGRRRTVVRIVVVMPDAEYRARLAAADAG